MSGFFQYNQPAPVRRDHEDNLVPLGEFKVEATDGKVGTVLTFEDEPGESFLVIDTGQWLLSKKVVIPASLIEDIDYDNEVIRVNRSQDEIKNAPEFDEETYRTHGYREELERHYSR